MLLGMVNTQDATAQASLLAMLDKFESLPAPIALRQRSYQLLGAEPGAKVVDVGCGAGRAVGELTEHGVNAVGVDPDPAMIAVARRRLPTTDLRAADAQALPFVDGELDGYRADKVYHQIPDPAAAVVEARRVLAPRGRIVLLGQDWDLIAVDSVDQPLTRRLVQAQADALPSPWTARRYRNLLLDAGFGDITVEVHTGVITDHSLLAPLLAGMADAGVAAGVADQHHTDTWLGRATTARTRQSVLRHHPDPGRRGAAAISRCVDSRPGTPMPG